MRKKEEIYFIEKQIQELFYIRLVKKNIFYKNSQRKPSSLSIRGIISQTVR